MDTIQYKGFEGSVEVDMDLRVCCGKILFIDDLVTYEAPDPNTLEAEFQAAVDDYLETCQQVGKEPQKPYRGVFQVRTSPEKHRKAARRAIVDGVALNEVVNRALDAYLDSPKVVDEPFVADGSVTQGIAAAVDTGEATSRQTIAVKQIVYHWMRHAETKAVLLSSNSPEPAWERGSYVPH